MSTYASLSGFYDYRLVTLSILIAVCSAYAALDLSRQLYSSRGFTKLIWLSGGSIAMGCGIWGMHYIGMEAFRLPVPVEYDWPTVLVSIAVAILASGMALYEVSRPDRRLRGTLIGSTMLGLGISTMHYIGMAAMRLPAMHVYSPLLLTLSIALAIAISYLALQLAFASRQNLCHVSWRKLGSAAVMGIAISSMHYVGMAAVSFVPMQWNPASLSHAISLNSLGLASICATILILLATVSIASIASRQAAMYAAGLEDNRTNIQTIFDSLKEGVVVLDADLNLIQCNPAAVTLLGLTGAAASRKDLAKTFEIFLPTGEPLPLDKWPSAMALKGQFLQSCEFRIRRTDTGRIAIADISTAPIRNRAGQIIQILVSYRDITQPREIDEARVRLAAIVESSEDAIIGKDIDGTITSWNAGAEKVFGYTAAEMIGGSVKKLLPEDRLHEEDEILSSVRRGETVDHIETIRKKKNGKFIHVSLMISPIRDSSGKVIGASKVARNITERKNLENQLYQSQKMEAIGQLTGGIAHDFNNLLGVVIGNLDLLERQIKGNEPALKRVATARNASLRGADLTRRLLAFSRQQELRPDDVDLGAAITNVLALAAPGLGPQIKVVSHLDSSIPSVFVDAAGLESAVLNLIVNARDAMSEGGTLTITSETRVVDHGPLLGADGQLKAGIYACVSISDTGQGMTPEIAQRAFEPFFTTKGKGKGTGLGLAMVHGFFNQSGGTVRIYSEPGYGTTVSFYLPVLLESAKATREPYPQEISYRASGTILVVDDEAELLEVASSSLEEIGYKLLTAKDGASALLLIEQHKDIDMLLTDIIMPGGMNGIELAEKVTSKRPEIKVIFCSGFPSDAFSEKILPLAERPLLRKPYQRSELLSVVRKTFLETSDGLHKQASSEPMSHE